MPIDHQDEAKRAAADAHGRYDHDTRMELFAYAQVHATLALVQATLALVQAVRAQTERLDT